MKRKILLKRLALNTALFTMWVVFIQAAEKGVDIPDKIINPEFELDEANTEGSSFSPIGWQKNFIPATSKISILAKGDGSIIKDGENHWQIWNGSSITGRMYQVINDLPTGTYLVRAGVFATFGGTINLYANKGKATVINNTSAYYEAVGIVADGTLEIGLEIATTEGTSIEFDHVTLSFQTEGELESYMEILKEKLEVAIENISSGDNPGYINLQQLHDAIYHGENVEQKEEKILEAIHALNLAIAEYEVILNGYAPLKEAINKFKDELESLDFSDKTEFETVLLMALEVYNSSQDQRENINSTIVVLTAKGAIFTSLRILGNTIKLADNLLNSSGYEGKSIFEASIREARSIYNNVPSGEEAVTEANTRLNSAIQTYLNNRPSNWVTIKNGALWKDNRGAGVQAHGAGFLQVGDTWYMVGENRSSQWNPDINMYSTKDFINWVFEGNIVQNGKHSFRYEDGSVGTLGSNRMIERPKLLYCAKTGQYVIWCHWEAGNYGASEAAVFYSEDVTGPYKLHWAGRPLGIKSRDCNVFQDDNGKAYFISTTEENQHLGLFELSDDYLSVVKHTQLFAWQSREAPAIVKVNGRYFMISSACSGWDPNQAKISYSHSLKSGWSSNQNIGGPISFDTQAASILTIQGREGTSYIYVGDRWQDPGLPESKTIMFPIEFNGTNCTFNYRQQFDLDLATGTYRETDTGNRVPKTDWTIRAVSSEETSSENGRAANAIDGNTDTKWHTKYSGGTASAPHFIEVDMGEAYDISGFLCIPRMDDSTNGTIRSYLFLVSSDGENWEAISGGTWLPYAAEVYFPSVSARYFRMVALEGTYASITELYVLMTSESYIPHEIYPYYRTGTTGWRNSSAITVNEDENLTFGPNRTVDGGTWAFYGPNNLMSATREYQLNGVAQINAGIYTSLYLDKSYNQSSKQNYMVTVNEKKVSIDGTTVIKQEIARKYYTLQGVIIPYPTTSGIYLVKKTYADGTEEIIKQIISN